MQMQAPTNPDGSPRHSVLRPTARATSEVLFIADLSEEERARYQAACERADARGLSVASVEAGRELLREGTTSPRCLVLDPSVPDAEELVTWLRGDPRWVGLPIVALAAHPSEGSFLRSHAIGADDVSLRTDPGGITRRLAALRDVARASVDPWRGRAWVAHPNEHQRRVVGRTLRQAGYDVGFADGAEELLERAAGDASTELVVISGKIVREGLIERLRRRAARAKPAVVVMGEPTDTDHAGEALGRIGIVPDDGAATNLLFVVNELCSPGVSEMRSSPRLLFSTLCAFRREHELSPEFGLTYNISRDGLYVRTMDPPPRHSVVWLELRPPGTAKIVHLRGQVVWTRVPGEGRGATTPPGFGVRILEERCPPPDLDRYRLAYHAFAEEPRPYAVEDFCRVTPVPEAPSAPTEGRVLVIEDDPQVQAVYRRALGRAGFEVTLAGDGDEGVARFAEGAFDAVITDLDMPEKQGVEVLEEIRAEDQAVPVIIVTGAPSTESAIGAIELGAFRYLTKPLDTSEVIATLGRAVNMARLAQLKREALVLHAETLGNRGPDETDAAFERALDRLFLHYQPIVSWSARDVYGYEALVRSREPSMPHPGALFGAAEKLERLDALGRAIRRIAPEPFSADAPHRLFVNLHPRELLDDELFSRDTALARAASRVTLEITERASLAGIPDFAQRIARLRDLGYAIAVDDIGAGYAGLTSLAHLEPDVAKLDMSLIRDVHRVPTKQRLVRSFCELCADLGIRLVAEGVETPQERDTLVELGCDLLQGFLFAKPGLPFPDCEL